MDYALSIENLSVNYGNIRAIKKINLNVKEGTVVAILGSNGAGKTSTLRTISGLVPAASGTIKFYGKDITNMQTENITKLGIVQSPEGRQVFRDLTVEENLKIGAFTLKSKSELNKNLENVFGLFPVLKERRTQISSTLSGGEQQMLAIARALMPNPNILLLDEPSLGLAPLIIKEIFKIVTEIRKMGKTVVIVEQNALQTLKISDYAYVLEVGEVIMEGDAEELRGNPKLIEAYLGN